MITITISEADAKKRLDKELRQLMPNATSGFIYKMLRKKNITLNDKKAKGSELLAKDDVIKLFLSDETYEKMAKRPEAKSPDSYCDIEMDDLDIIYEDNELIVVNKPAGILSQKSAYDDISLNEEILSYLAASGQLDSKTLRSYTPSVVNRLDRNTSGLILAAKTYQAARSLSAAMADKSCRKFYRCIVKGIINKESTEDAFLTKDSVTNTVRISSTAENGAKPIKTRFYPISIGSDMTHLEVELLTGRSHQIRAHMAYLGHPVIGDPKYGDERLDRLVAKEYGIKTQLLHSYRLVLPDDREFTAPLPKSFLLLPISDIK